MYIVAAIVAAALVWLLRLVFLNVTLLLCRAQMARLLRKRAALAAEEEVRSDD